MLSILTFALLACAAALGVVFSSENTLAVLVWGLAAFILFPVVLILAFLSVGLSALESVIPVAGEWGDLVGSYVNGGYGFPGLYYVLGATVLWFITLFKFADEDAGTDQTSAKTDDTTDTSGTDSAGSEIRDLTDLSGVGEETAEKLSGAGFETVEHISAADQDQLQSVEGVSTALAVRIKAETDDIEVSDEVDADVEEKRKKTQQQIRQNEYQRKIDSVRSTFVDVDTRIRLQHDLNKLDGIESRLDSLAQEYSDRHQTDEIDKLRESINKKRKEIEQGRKIQEKIQSIRSDLDDIEHLATYEKFEKAHQRLEQLGSEIESAKETASKYEFDDLQNELAQLNHQRQEQLEEVKKSHREQQEYRQLEQEVNNISNDLQKTETLIKNKEVEQARQNLEQLGSDIESAKDTASNYEFDDLQDELAKLNQQRQEQLEEIKKRRQLRQEAENTSDELESDDREKSESESHAGEDTSKTTGTEGVDKQLEAEKEAVGSHIEDALSAPFRDPESTRKQLVQGHKMMAELAESAAESEREDILESAERSLGEIENQLEALSEATDSLKSARSHVPPDEEPSDSMSISTLEAARASYTSAIDIADEAGFDTEGVENERADISSTLERIEEQAVREELLETLQSLHSRLGRAPKATELPEGCEYSQYDYRTEFGSWDEALEAAGIDREKSMLEEIERVAEKLGCVPDYADMDEHGSYSGPNYMSYFGSWSEALERSDVAETRKGHNEEKLLEKLRSLQDGHDRIPKPADLHDVREISQHDYIQNFGSWDKALEAAGIDKKESLIDDLKKVAAEVGGRPDTTTHNRFGEYSPSMHKGYFGSWNAALEAADVLSMDTVIGERQETEEQYSGPATLDPATSIDDIEDKIDGVGRGSIRAVKKAEYNTLGELQDAKPDEITKYKGVGRTKALKLIRFANENVSGNSASSGQSSGHQQSVGQSSSSTPGTNSNQIEPSALNTSWETIPANERIDEQFLIRVTDVDQQVGSRKTAQLDVQDQNGRKFGMNIWSKHDVDQEWSEGEWYALENARGKVWESNDGTTRKQFSSTKDLKVVELGPDFDPNTASVGDSSETASEPEESGATTDEDTSMSSAGRPTSNGNNGDSDSGGILGDITDEFEEL